MLYYSHILGGCIMFKVYNKRAVTRQERFQKALVYGIIFTLLITLLYGLFTHFLHIEFSIVYLFVGYLIGAVIQKYGRGVQIQFSILAAFLAVFCFLFGDMIAWFGLDVLFAPTFWSVALQAILSNYFNLNINSLLSLLFRVGGVYLAYSNARII